MNSRIDRLAQIVILVAAGVFSENWTETSEKITYSHYQGHLGNAAVTLDLQIASDSMASGYYSYERYGIPISFRGIRKGDSIQFQEYDQYNDLDSEGAKFYGRVNNGRLRGGWMGSKRYKFDLIEDYSHSADSTLLRNLNLHPSSIELKYENAEVDEAGFTSISQQVFFNSESILVIVSQSDSESKFAAHPNHSTSYTTIDLRTKKKLELYNIIRSGSEDALWKVIQKKLNISDKTNQSYRIEESDEIILTNKALGLYFDRGSTLLGEVVFLPFNEIPRRCLNPDFKLVEINRHDVRK